MKRSATICLACLVGLFIGSVVVFLMLHASPGRTDGNQEQVIQLSIARIRGKSTSTLQPKVAQISIVGTYAMTTFTWGEGGGTVVLSQINGVWRVLGSGGGFADADVLQGFGIPADVAAQLIANLAPPATPTATPRKTSAVSTLGVNPLLGAGPVGPPWRRRPAVRGRSALRGPKRPSRLGPDLDPER